jgi:deoxyadenosine/deoxycytidine kinase
MSNTNITIISVEGNIGSGKSTLLENLKTHFKKNTSIVFLKEPVDEWAKIQDEKGVTMLEKFYSDQEKYSFPFQMMAYVSRLKVLRDTLKELKKMPEQKFVIITERSLYTDKMVFAQMLFDSGKIEYINFQIYLNWFDTFSEEFPVHKVIYVKTNPLICYARIIRRAREGEDTIPFEYLQTCHTYHTNMLSNPVFQEQLLLDGDNDIYKNNTIVKIWIGEIERFII